jgi:predicted nucleotidyltransferase
MILNRHFREFLELLERHKVEFLIVGGYAVGLHGFPRYTGDLDVFVAISRANAAQLVKAFADFGFSDLKLSENDFLTNETIVEIGREPVKIQILTGIDGVAFDACYRRRIKFEDSGLQIPFISFDDLIANKAASPRAKDKIDLDELRRIRENAAHAGPGSPTLTATRRAGRNPV